MLSHALPRLVTAGNRILRSDTLQTVVLRGVNRSGLEYTEPGPDGILASAAFTEDEVREITVSWRSNVIRVPFNQDWALRDRAGYLAALDQVVDWAALWGAYTILDLQWLDRETVFGTTSGRDNHVAPTPNPDTPELWRTLAARYRGEPAVLFDLFNEPHDRLLDDPHPLHLIAPDRTIVESDTAKVDAAAWNAWADFLVAEIRREHPESLILIGGIDWAFDLRGIQIDAPNIVYSAHIYPNRKRRDWTRALARAAEVPVFVGEWGGKSADLEFGRVLARRMADLNLSWTAWSWVDDPPLVESPRSPLFQPTPFGNLVLKELRARLIPDT